MRLPKQNSVERIMMVGFALVGGVMLFFAVVSFRATARWMKLSDYVSRSQQVRVQLVHALSSVSEAEEAERFYIIAGSESDFARYRAALKRIGPELSRLSSLVSDNPGQRSRVATLQRDIRIRLARLELGAQIRRRAGYAALSQKLKGRIGPKEMLVIRRDIAEMDREEVRLLDRRSSDFRDYASRNTPIFDGLCLVALTALGLVFLGVRQISRARHKAIQELVASHKDLQESRLFAESVARQTTSLLYIYDLETLAHVWANRNIAETLGYGPDASGLLNRDILAKIVHPADFAAAPDYLERCRRASDDEILEYETRFHHANGEWRRLWSRDRVFKRKADGTPLQMIGAARDVTDRRRAEETIRSLSEALQQATEGIARHDSKGRFLTVNEAYAKMSGYSPDEMVGMHWTSTVPVEAHALGHARNEEMKRTGKFVFEIPGERPDGSPYYKEVSLSRELDSEGCYIGYYAFTKDITERKRAEAALTASEGRFRAAIQAMQEGFAIYDMESEIIVCNESAIRRLGLTPEQMLGRAPLDSGWSALREDGSDFPLEEHPANRTLKEGIAQTGVVMGARNPDGELIWVSINSQPLARPDESQPYGVVVTLSDITQRMWFEEQIQHQIEMVNEANRRLEEHEAELAAANYRLEALAQTDGLTGLNNHRAFQEKLTSECVRARRYNSPLSILMLDVDHFKDYNDDFGHPAGDGALKLVADVLRTTARNTDFVARYGGEEFALILPETDAKGAFDCAERIRAAIAATSWEGRRITVSLGASSLNPVTESPADLLSEADKALYESKSAGRNRVTLAAAQPQRIAA